MQLFVHSLNWIPFKILEQKKLKRQPGGVKDNFRFRASSVFIVIAKIQHISNHIHRRHTVQFDLL